ncbi:MAG: ferrous iron transport protein B [Verrucomicrobiaceae bacterium]|nr:ferrous iron transport protein B [Verrucomicrobiaceae bacterium]
MLYALVGNPNCGKTTIFNALTGLRQKVANYPGVTVEKKVGECISQHGQKMRLIDLPGSYSLNARSPDEAVMRDVLLGRQAGTPRPDRVICVLDASNLERNLYLATQVIELGLPTILALNMMDVAQARGLRVDGAALSRELGVPVVECQASTGTGILPLKLAMSQADLPPSLWKQPSLPDTVTAQLASCRNVLCEIGAIDARSSMLEPLYLINDHDPTHYGIAGEHVQHIRASRERVESLAPGWEQSFIRGRYDAIGKIVTSVVSKVAIQGKTATDRLDALLLHPLFGIVGLGLVLTLLGYMMFTVAEGPMGWIEGVFGSLAEWVKSHMPEGDVRDLITDGVIAGVSGVVVFLPQILILFFFVGIMEDTGYMARVAFIVDRVMSWVGLNGKAFLPILSSHACAVPGIMATRSIDSPKDRLVTILVAPLAACSARIPVYSLLIATLMPSSEVPPLTKSAIFVALYATGLGGAFFFAWLFKGIVMRGASSPMVLEMPAYKLPSWRSILLHLWERAWVFLRRAGSVIVGITILIWAASTYPKTAGASSSENLANSFAGRAGHLIEPIIKPLGYDWKIGIGLIGSFAARELFVGTMGVVYAVESEDDDLSPLRDRLREEKWPVGAPVYTPAVCLSLLVFYVFAMQCMSTLAVTRRETNSWKWPLFQLGYLSLAAYTLAFLAYQVGLRLCA